MNKTTSEILSRHSGSVFLCLSFSLNLTLFCSPFCSQLYTTSRYLKMVGKGSLSLCANRKQKTRLSQLFLAKGNVPSTVQVPTVRTSSQYMSYSVKRMQTFSHLVSV